MIFIADVLPSVEGLKRLMIHETENGVCLFGFDRVADGSGSWDEWYETVVDAKEAAYEAWQVCSEAWTQIADPCADCQQDWIQPIRIKGRNLGQPEWDKLERLLNGQWLVFDPEEQSKHNLI